MNTPSKKLWGGRFSRDIDPAIIGWTESITIDSELVVEDIWGSIAHVTMLGSRGIIPVADTAAILRELRSLADEYVAGKWALRIEQEDVHMNVESRIIERLGIDVGGKMHTARSRNDQVPLDSKLYTRRRLLELREKLLRTVEAFINRATEFAGDVMVSYTHVQHAQPISVAFWLSHYAAVLLRDLDRLKRAYDLTDQCPLGAGAIAGTSLPIDRELTADLLGFQTIHEHGLDATSSRDFMLEVLSANAILATTLSRLAEEFILWSSYEFRTLMLDDGFAMGSSMMPQKKNPGALELLRGRSGRINGLLVAGLTLMKGLPSGYNRDFHEEKEVLVASLTLANRAVEVIPALVQSTTIRKERMAELCDANFSVATELANHLVARYHVAFRKAHHIVGTLVGKLNGWGLTLKGSVDQCLEHLAEHGIEAQRNELARALSPEQVMRSYTSLGGTSPSSVKEMLGKFRDQLSSHRTIYQADRDRVDRAQEACRRISHEAVAAQSIEELSRIVGSHRPGGR